MKIFARLFFSLWLLVGVVGFTASLIREDYSEMLYAILMIFGALFGFFVDYKCSQIEKRLER